MRKTAYVAGELGEYIANQLQNKAAAHTRLNPGTRIHCCRCSLPGLAGFTISRRGETGRATIIYEKRDYSVLLL